MVKFLFSVHTITQAKPSNGQDRSRAGARAVDLPARSFDLAPWCSAATAYNVRKILSLALLHCKLMSKRETGCTLQPAELVEVTLLIHTALSSH